MEEVLPNKKQARRLVVSLGVFWACSGIAVVSFTGRVTVLGGVVAVIGAAFAFRFSLTLFRVWEPETGESAWRAMLDPTFTTRQWRTTLHFFDVLRPRWIRHTLRETGWSPKLIGYGLLILALLDLVLLSSLLPQIGNK